MTSPHFATTGQSPRIERVEALAFHDDAGNIRHMHHYIVLEGAAPRPCQDMREEVMAQALALGNDLSTLQMLHIKEPFNFSAPHKVNVKKGILVELPAPARNLKIDAASPKKKR